MSRKRAPAIADEQVMSKIHTVRGHKVMLDHDLAELYVQDGQGQARAVVSTLHPILVEWHETPARMERTAPEAEVSHQS